MNVFEFIICAFAILLLFIIGICVVCLKYNTTQLEIENKNLQKELDELRKKKRGKVEVIK